MNMGGEAKPTFASVSMKVAGLPDSCCSKVNAAFAGMAKTPPEEPTEEEDKAMETACDEGSAQVTGVWSTVGFTATDNWPLTSLNGYAMVDGALAKKAADEAEAAEADETGQKKMALKIQQMAGLLAGFQRFYASISWSKAQMHLSVNNFALKALGTSIEYDETKAKAKMQAAMNKGGGEGGDGEMSTALLENAAAYVLPKLSQHVTSIIQMTSSSKSDSAFPFTLGAVSLVGSLVLMGVVAAAFVVRRRQARTIQGSNAATEMTSQEVA